MPRQFKGRNPYYASMIYQGLNTTPLLFGSCVWSHQFSHTLAGITRLITVQCPKPLRSWYAASCSVSLLRTRRGSSLARKSVSNTSCFGVRKYSRVLLFNISVATGWRKVTSPLVLMQNMTTLVKSWSSVSSSSFGCSLNIRHEGKTCLMVCTTALIGVSWKSPAKF